MPLRLFPLKKELLRSTNQSVSQSDQPTSLPAANIDYDDNNWYDDVNADGWMTTDRLMDGWMNERLNGYTEEQMYGWMDRLVLFMYTNLQK